MKTSVLILYDPKGPAIVNLADAIAKGVEKHDSTSALLKSIESATTTDLIDSDAIILGSPNWSGITGTFKDWLDNQGDLWEEGSLAGKPGAAFTSGWGRHSGLEITLSQLIHWMLACGMLIVGLPWSNTMKESGSYYGVTATAGVNASDLIQAQNLGFRVSQITARLRRDKPA